LNTFTTQQQTFAEAKRILAAKNSRILDWRRVVHKQSVCLEGNALQTSYRAQYTQG